MITTAVQKGSYVYVYSGSRLLFSKSGELHGYTATSVSIKQYSVIYVYNDKGSLITTHHA